MWELLVVFILDGVAVLNRKTYYPPMLGDLVELSQGTVGVVVERHWKSVISEHAVLDVVLKRSRRKP